MRRDEVFPSKYVRASDLPQPRVVTISNAAMEPMKNDGKDVDKLVLSFRERIKPLVVNLTIFEAIEQLYGGETNDWVGQRVEIHADRCRFGGKMVDCVRVRAPAQAELLVNGNGATRPVAKPQPQPRVNPDPRENVGTPPDDLNDFYDDAVPSFDPPGKV
jgi:hypothetical protein